MRTLKASLLSVGLIAALTSSAAAQQVGFDDVTSNPMGTVPNGYAGLNWTNAWVVSPLGWFGTQAAAGGFYTAQQSASYVLFNPAAANLGISGAASFNLLGGTFAAAWRNGLSVTATGYSGSTQLYSQTFQLNWNAAQWINLGMYGVDNVVFSSTGGTVDPRFEAGNNTSFAVDNLLFGVDEKYIGQERDFSVREAVVPEPMTMSLVGFGLLAVAGLNARRRRVATA